MASLPSYHLVGACIVRCTNESAACSIDPRADVDS